MASRLPYPQDHASHIPILKAIGRAFTIRTVFEYGAGPYSTSLFLDRSVFPDLTSMSSVEPDPVWQDKVQAIIGEDSRHIFLKEEPQSWAPGMHDLIFIDNGPEQHKIETIRKYSKMILPNTIVVVHDAEVETYRAEIVKFNYYKIFAQMNPETAVCSYQPMAQLSNLQVAG